MTNEVFAWTAASNNQGYLSGRLSLAVNAISIIRSAEDANPALAQNTSVAPIPRGPVQRLGLEHVMGVYTIWKFSNQKTLAKRFIADLEINYQGAFKNSKFYNFPAFRGAVHNYATQLAADPHKGKYKVLDLIARKYTVNVGLSGLLQRGGRRDLQHVAGPADVRPGSAGQDDARRRRERGAARVQADLRQVEGPREDLAI
jgi:multiple sugar transport system substrate-binding protein